MVAPCSRLSDGERFDHCDHRRARRLAAEVGAASAARPAVVDEKVHIDAELGKLLHPGKSSDAYAALVERHAPKTP